MAQATFEGPIEVPGRLASLALDEPALRGAVEEGVKRHLFNCTKNDPAPGIVGYDKITRALRDRLIPTRNWKREKRRQQPITIRVDGRVAVIVAGGDDFTGLIDPDLPDPSTRSKKGTATVGAVQDNVASFADIDPTFAEVVPARPEVQTWVLLYYVDPDNLEIRVELSLPIMLNDEQHICKWYDRIVLAPIPFDAEDVPVEEDDDEGDDGIDVTARNG